MLNQNVVIYAYYYTNNTEVLCKLRLPKFTLNCVVK